MNMKNRQRGRNGGKPRPHQQHQGSRNQNFDGGNNMRMRGNAQQLMEKYLQLARDATAAGDRVMAENYFQHADHYYRVINARFEQNGQRRPNDQQRNDRSYDNDGQYNDDNQSNYNNSSNYNNAPNYNNNQGGQSHMPAPQGQPQQPYQQQPQYQPPAQPQPPRQPEGDIGLPPGILGMEPLPVAAEPAPATRETEDQGNRPRQPRRRRGGGRGEGSEAVVETAE